MSEKTESVEKLIESLTPSELESLTSYLRSKLPMHALEQKWRISYELILDAIYRSQDIVQRGVRGVIAEAVFEAKVLPAIRGWRAMPVIGDLPYDFNIRRDSDQREIKIQVKLQRTQGGAPLIRAVFGPDTFIVEVQKTRSGTKRKRKGALDAKSAPTAPEKTRPYQFGDFDIIAVNMQPSTQDWSRFMYTVGSWLMARAGDKKLIEIMQPVSRNRSDVWTDSIEECINWFLSGQRKVVFDMKAAKRRKEAERKAKNAAKRNH
ncbi:MAG: hypothetical protein ABR920_13155 [Terriglobales bacterium]